MMARDCNRFCKIMVCFLYYWKKRRKHESSLVGMWCLIVLILFPHALINCRDWLRMSLLLLEIQSTRRGKRLLLRMKLVESCAMSSFFMMAWLLHWSQMARNRNWWLNNLRSVCLLCCTLYSSWYLDAMLIKRSHLRIISMKSCRCLSCIRCIQDLKVNPKAVLFYIWICLLVIVTCRLQCSLFYFLLGVPFSFLLTSPIMLHCIVVWMIAEHEIGGISPDSSYLKAHILFTSLFGACVVISCVRKFWDIGY